MSRPVPVARALMWSTVRAMSACRSGLRYELQLTSGPNSTRSVCSAIAASTVHASKCSASIGSVSGRKWSQLKIASTPRSSARSTASRYAA